jgi:hypothetical protein
MKCINKSERKIKEKLCNIYNGCLKEPVPCCVNCNQMCAFPCDIYFKNAKYIGGKMNEPCEFLNHN